MYTLLERNWKILLGAVMAFCIWAIALITWQEGWWGQEGFWAGSDFGWVLTLFPIIVAIGIGLGHLVVLQTEQHQLGASRRRSRLFEGILWSLGITRRPKMKVDPWRPYWILNAAVDIAGLIMVFRMSFPWNLIVLVATASILLCQLWWFAALKLQGVFGSDTKKEEIAFMSGRSWWAFIPSGIEDAGTSQEGGRRILSKMIALGPFIWAAYAILILLIGWKPLVWTLEQPAYYAAGLSTLLYWALYLLTRWRRYGFFVRGKSLVAVVPDLGWFPNSRTGTAEIAKIASTQGSPNFLGFYQNWGADFQFSGEDRIDAKYVPSWFVRMVEQLAEASRK